MPRQAAVGETASVGPFGHVHHPARCDERPEPAEHISSDLRHLGGGGDSQPGPAQHAVAHHRLGRLVEAVATGPDPARQTDLVVPRGKGRRRRPHFGVGQRQVGQIAQLHALTLPLPHVPSRATTHTNTVTP